MRVAHTLPLAALLLASGSASAQELYGVFDGAPGEGISSFHRFGDWNNDGVQDLLVVTILDGGAPPAKAYIVSGATLTRVGSTFVAPPGSGTGTSVRPAGDFDGDGTPDVARANEGSSTSYASNVEILSGSDASVLARVGYLTYPNAGPGLLVEGMGDLNADGYDDVIVIGARFVSQSRASASSIVWGPVGNVEHAFVATSGVNYGHYRRHYHVGDQDGDGAAEMSAVYSDAVNSPGEDDDEYWAWSKSWVLSHPDDDFADLRRPATEGFGAHLVSVHDLDGTGIDDLAIGARGRDFGDPCCASGYVALVSDNGFQNVIATLREADRGEPGNPGEWGSHLAAGDVNGDGVDELLVEAPAADAQRGYVDVISLATYQLLWRIRLEGPDDVQIRRPVFLGDLDGDGYGEFAVMDPFAGYAGPAAGRIWVFRGAPGEAKPFCPGAVTSSESAAALQWIGPLDVGGEHQSLRLSKAPADSAALAFYGAVGSPQPAGDGWLCLGSPTFRLGAPFALDSDGIGFQPIDWASGPHTQGAGAWAAGTTWAVQAAFRDAAGPGGTGFNFSDGLVVTFVP